MQLRERNINKEFFSDENTYTECVRKLVKFKDGAIFLCHKFLRFLLLQKWYCIDLVCHLEFSILLNSYNSWHISCSFCNLYISDDLYLKTK